MDARTKAQQYGLYDSRFEHDACGVGFVCNVKAIQSHEVIRQGLEVLDRLAHRGATGADPKTGDGAGILIQMPHGFFSKVCDVRTIKLPEPGAYGAGLVFLPRSRTERAFCKKVFAACVRQMGQRLLGWREVPVDNSDIGKAARESQPVIEQVFIASNAEAPVGKEWSAQEEEARQLAFERTLYIIRKKVENAIRAASLKQRSFFYITNLSCRTFSYKGLLMAHQVEKFFLDLHDPAMESCLCLVHSRYSTNTFPTWDLAQPFRFLAHNGEINTVRGNINWMRGREGLLKSALFGKHLKDILPTIVPGGSDSATLDNVFELLVLSGRPLEQAMTMLIPAAWEQNAQLDKKVRDFYRYHSCLMEPWDGPAAIAFTDGRRIGAILDRNGLRPARYIITRKNMVVMASEAGVLDIHPEDVVVSGRLEPGKMFFIDTTLGRIIDDAEIKERMARRHPYGQWLKENLVEFDALKGAKQTRKEKTELATLLQAFGYTREDLRVIIKPMAETGQEPVGSMGNDTPHAVLSQRPQLLYSYFKQLFAQVTNPAIDPIREEVVMSLYSLVGPEKNLLEEAPGHCHKLFFKKPILTNAELERVRHIKERGFSTKTISILFKTDDPKDFLRTLRRISAEAHQAIKDGHTFIILSDRGVCARYAALPMLLAVGAVHHHLTRKAVRTQIGIFLESAEPREVHHFALLFGYGADCINPYLAYSAVEHLIDEKELSCDKEAALRKYIAAVYKGIQKVLSKMGISTLQSYRGAQIFEALGLHPEVIDDCFAGTVSRISGAGFAEIGRETVMRHRQAFPDKSATVPVLPAGGLYQWRKDGEFHLWNPESIAALQQAVRQDDYALYREFCRLINDQSQHPTTLRGILKFSTKNLTPVPLEKVEPVESIVRRFASGAMSFGSMSRNAHETIAVAMNRLKGRSNTGEGGEDPARFAPLPNGDSCRSAVKQVASGRFGVTTNYLVNADEIQIKIAQGAKPGEGGQLPGHKVSVVIARTRYTTPGVTLISPPPHHDIYSIEDLAQLIFDLKNTNPKARISVKLVSEIGVGTVAAGVAKGHADMILISGGDGGTGASPLSSIKHAGLPWELGLSETHQTLVLNDLRSRVRLQTDGQMRTGRDVAIAALLGAEEFGFATAILVTLGCVMLRHCHLNNCSAGLATQDELLEKRFAGKPEYIINYLHFVATELREIMSALGVHSIDEMVGRTDLLELDRSLLPWKAGHLDFSRLLYKPEVPRSVATRKLIEQDHAIDDVLDRRLIEHAAPALLHRQRVSIKEEIHNTNRSVGAMLSGRVCMGYGEQGFLEDTIHCRFKGIAGQSFGAFLAQGITFELEGMANDYVGKGISGGKIIIYPDRKTVYDPSENILIGNTTFYGAISGQAYINGLAGERFCIRNSGLSAVVEGVGDHGCEYMTGGRVVILGKTGRNFAAGMSGGIAYVYDNGHDFGRKCNCDMVVLEPLGEEDEELLRNLLHCHYTYTQSKRAFQILNAFKHESKSFVKVIPLEYKRIWDEQKIEKKLQLTEVSDG